MEFHTWGRDYYPEDDNSNHQKEHSNVECAIHAQATATSAHIGDEVYEK
jgi:hypothetical protein